MFVSDCTQLHLPGLHPWRMPAHVYGEEDIACFAAPFLLLCPRKQEKRSDFPFLFPAALHTERETCEGQWVNVNECSTGALKYCQMTKVRFNCMVKKKKKQEGETSFLPEGGVRKSVIVYFCLLPAETDVTHVCGTVWMMENPPFLQLDTLSHTQLYLFNNPGWRRRW